MTTSGKKSIQKISSKIEIKADEIWNDEKMNAINEYILKESVKQSPEQKLRNELLSIKYQMEDYIEKDKIEREMQLLDFVKLYLNLLNISQKQLASAFGMKAANFYKYLTGERKLNADLALKLGAFSHTQPELWYNIQIKNEFFELRKEKEKIKEYEKYDYQNLVTH